MSKHRNDTMLIGLVALAVTLNVSVASAALNPFPGLDPNAVIRLDPNALSRPVVDLRDRHAEETYAKNGAEIVP